MSRAASYRRRGIGLLQILWQLLPAVLFGALFAVVGVIHVTSRISVVDVGYRLSSFQGEVRSLLRENDQLKLEMATLKSPARLEKIAREKLGMAPPSPAAVISLTPAPRLARSGRLGSSRRGEGTSSAPLIDRNRQP